MANTFSLFPNLTKSKESPNLKLNKYQLNDQDLKQLTIKVGNRPVVVLSIFGSCRSGKGFLFSLFVKYLTWEEGGQQGQWYSSNDKLDALEWKGGSNRHTIGIHIYNRPFIIKKDDGEEIAVLLMDTEGTEDTTDEISKVLAFSMLVSSFQIYNLHRLVNEFNLQLLSVFTQIGADLNKGNTNDSYMFPDLMFLIRDWQNSDEHDYGHEGGNQYICKKLAVEEGQSDEQRSVREHMHSTFGQILGFLLPHPGLSVASSKSSMITTIQEMDIENEFMQSVEHLYQVMLQQLLETNGKTVFGPDLFTFMETNARHIARDDVDVITSLSEGLVMNANIKALKHAEFLEAEKNKYLNKHSQEEVTTVKAIMGENELFKAFTQNIANTISDLTTNRAQGLATNNVNSQIARDDVSITDVFKNLQNIINEFEKAKQSYADRIRLCDEKLQNLISGRETGSNISLEIEEIHKEAAGEALRQFQVYTSMMKSTQPASSTVCHFGENCLTIWLEREMILKKNAYLDNQKLKLEINNKEIIKECTTWRSLATVQAFLGLVKALYNLIDR